MFLSSQFNSTEYACSALCDFLDDYILIERSDTSTSYLRAFHSYLHKHLRNIDYLLISTLFLSALTITISIFRFLNAICRTF